MSDPFRFLRPPYVLFTVGMVFLLAAGVYTYTGKAWIRFHGWVYRAEKPKRFWLEVVTYFLLGLGLIGLSLCKIHGLSK